MATLADTPSPYAVAYDALILAKSRGDSVMVRALKALSPDALARILKEPATPVREAAPARREGEIWETNGKRYTLKNGHVQPASADPRTAAAKPAAAARGAAAPLSGIWQAYSTATGKAKEHIAAAIHNAGADKPEARKGLPATLDKAKLGRMLAMEWQDAHEAGDTDSVKAIAAALAHLGAKPAHAAGDTIPMDGSQYAAPDGGGVFTGDQVKVKTPAIVSKTGITVRPGTVHPPEKKAAAETFTYSKPVAIGGGVFKITAHDADGREIGAVEYANDDGKISIGDVKVLSIHRRKGIATELYKQMLAANPGAKIKSMLQSDDAVAFRKKFDAEHPGSVAEAAPPEPVRVQEGKPVKRVQCHRTATGWDLTIREEDDPTDIPKA